MGTLTSREISRGYSDKAGESLRLAGYARDPRRLGGWRSRTKRDKYWQELERKQRVAREAEQKAIKQSVEVPVETGRQTEAISNIISANPGTTAGISARTRFVSQATRTSPAPSRVQSVDYNQKFYTGRLGLTYENVPSKQVWSSPRVSKRNVATTIRHDNKPLAGSTISTQYALGDTQSRAKLKKRLYSAYGDKEVDTSLKSRINYAVFNKLDSLKKYGILDEQAWAKRLVGSRKRQNYYALMQEETNSKAKKAFYKSLSMVESAKQIKYGINYGVTQKVKKDPVGIASDVGLAYAGGLVFRGAGAGLKLMTSAKTAKVGGTILGSSLMGWYGGSVGAKVFLADGVFGKGKALGGEAVSLGAYGAGWSLSGRSAASIKKLVPKIKTRVQAYKAQRELNKYISSQQKKGGLVLSDQIYEKYGNLIIRQGNLAKYPDALSLELRGRPIKRVTGLEVVKGGKRYRILEAQVGGLTKRNYNPVDKYILSGQKTTMGRNFPDLSMKEIGLSRKALDTSAVAPKGLKWPKQKAKPDYYRVDKPVELELSTKQFNALFGRMPKGEQLKLSGKSDFNANTQRIFNKARNPSKPVDTNPVFYFRKGKYRWESISEAKGVSDTLKGSIFNIKGIRTKGTTPEGLWTTKPRTSPGKNKKLSWQDRLGYTPKLTGKQKLQLPRMTYEFKTPLESGVQTTIFQPKPFGKGQWRITLFKKYPNKKVPSDLLSKSTQKSVLKSKKVKTSKTDSSGLFVETKTGSNQVLMTELKLEPLVVTKAKIKVDTKSLSKNKPRNKPKGKTASKAKMKFAKAVLGGVVFADVFSMGKSRTRVATKSASISVQQPRFGVAVASMSSSKSAQAVWSESLVGTKSAIKSLSASKGWYASKAIPKVSVASKAGSKYKSVQAIKTASVSISKTGNPVIPSPKIPTLPKSKIPRPEKPKRPGTLPEWNAKKSKKSKVEGFDVYAKSRKRWVKVNKKAMQKNSALILGSKVVDNTTSVSFKLKKRKKTIKELKIVTFKFNSSKFRKKKNGVFVEKNKHRIDSIGEFRGITVQGWKARKNKLGGIL